MEKMETLYFMMLSNYFLFRCDNGTIIMISRSPCLLEISPIIFLNGYVNNTQFAEHIQTKTFKL